MVLTIVVLGLMTLAFIAGMVARDTDAESRIDATEKACRQSLDIEREAHREALRDAVRRATSGRAS